MRAGNGRHRRPRQAPAPLVAVGITGAGLAIPLLSATSAQAADTGTWDKVAKCESGSLWSANSGNGFFGGLQLTQETWERYGGTSYAKRPDLASRSQQIAVGERVFEQEGPEAFPRCSLNAGLTLESTAVPDIDPGDLLPSGVTPSPGRTTPGGSGGERADTGDSSAAADTSRAPAPAGTAGPSGAAPDAGDQARQQDPAVPRTGEGAGEGTGRHRGRPDPEETRQQAGSGRPDGQSSPDVPQSLDERSGKHATKKHSERNSGQYRVRPGDSLSAIAQKHGVDAGWPAVYAANQDVVGIDPDLILPGQHLDLDLR